MNFTKNQLELFEKVKEIFEETPVYLVGGAVRSILMNKEPSDYDFCISIEPDYIESSIKSSGRRAYLTGKRFGTIGCKIDGKMIEVTTFRTEEYNKGNRKPIVSYIDSISEDLSRRDFSINSMAVRIDNLKLIDQFNGQDDIKNKLIRCVGKPGLRFKEDPLRMLRAFRFSSQTGFNIEEGTFKSIKKKAYHILDISKERWVTELDKLLLGDNVENALKLLFESGLIKYMIPELNLQYNYDQNSKYHKLKLHEHTLKVVGLCPKDLNLKWAALLHDIAKPFARIDKWMGIDGDKEHQELSESYIKSNYPFHEVLGKEFIIKISKYLKFSNERTEVISDLVLNHLKDECELRKYDNLAK